MAEKILTQDEMNALFQGVKEGKGEKGEAAGEGERKSESSFSAGNIFPLLQPQSLTKDVESALALIYDAFAHKGTSALSSLLRSYVHFKLESLEQLTYRDYIHTLPEPSSMWYLRIRSTDLHIGLCLEPALVHAVIALLMGGNASIPKGRRNITELEQSVLEAVVTLFSKELSQAWSRVMDFQLQIDARETRPRLLQMYPSNERVTSITMSLKVGTSEGEIYWCIPHSVLELLQVQIESQNQSKAKLDIGEAIQRIKSIMMAVPVQMEAEIQGRPLRVTDLVALTPGDVLNLEHRIDDPLDVTVNGSKKFPGLVVLSRDRRAIEIL